MNSAYQRYWKRYLADIHSYEWSFSFERRWFPDTHQCFDMPFLRINHCFLLHHKPVSYTHLQDFALLPFHCVLENILLPLHLAKKAVDQAHVEMLLQALDIAQLTTALPQELSGGEQQRVAIARAFVHQPKLLLMDEPTGNLDSENTHILMEMLKELHEKQKTTILLVTHDRDVAAYAERTLLLQDGKFIEKCDNH